MKGAITGPPRRGIGSFGECSICLFMSFRKVPPPAVVRTVMEEYSGLEAGAPVMDWVLERLERKSTATTET